jgi:hypothetical protein
MSEAIVKKNELKLNGREFWRGAAESVQLADAGEIRNALGQPSWFEAKDRVPPGTVKVKVLGNISIDSRRTSAIDFLGEIGLKAFPLAFKGSAAYQAVIDRKLELLCLEIETDDMVRAINGAPNIREKLKGWGNDARVCMSLFVVVTAETRRQFSASTEHEAEFMVNGVNIKPKLAAGSTGDTTIRLEKGMTFAYGIAKPIWDDPKLKNAKRLVDLRFDNHT